MRVSSAVGTSIVYTPIGRGRATLPTMERPPRLVMVFEYDIDPATWRSSVEHEARERMIKAARGLGYEPVLDGDNVHAHVQHMIDRLAEAYALASDGKTFALDMTIEVA